MQLDHERLLHHAGGHPALIRHHDDLKSRLIEQPHRVDGKGEQRESLESIEVPHVDIDGPVAIEKHG